MATKVTDMPYLCQLTPSSRGVEKYLASVSSDRTKAHSMTPSSPSIAWRTESTNLAPAKAMDRVAEPWRRDDGSDGGGGDGSDGGGGDGSDGGGGDGSDGGGGDDGSDGGGGGG